MNSWKIILATMVIFGAGVITGGLLVRQSMLRPAHAAHRTATPNNPRNPQSFTPGNVRLEFLRRAQKELDLTPEQRAKIDEILKRSQERSRKTMESVAPKLREEVQKSREEFREVLTREQRTKFDRLWKQQQQRPREQRPMQRERMPGPPQPEGQNFRPGSQPEPNLPPPPGPGEQP